MRATMVFYSEEQMFDVVTHSTESPRDAVPLHRLQQLGGLATGKVLPHRL